MAISYRVLVMQEIESSVQSNMKDYYKAVRFMMTMLLSCLLAVLIGMWLDEKLHTTPIILLLLLAYAIIANLYLLMKGMSEHDG